MIDFSVTKEPAKACHTMQYRFFEEEQERVIFEIALGCFTDVIFKTSAGRKDILEACIAEGFTIEEGLSSLPVKRKINNDPDFKISDDMQVAPEDLDATELEDDEVIEVFFKELAGIEFRGNKDKGTCHTVIKYTYGLALTEEQAGKIFDQFSLANNTFSNFLEYLSDSLVMADLDQIDKHRLDRQLTE